MLRSRMHIAGSDACSILERAGDADGSAAVTAASLTAAAVARGPARWSGGGPARHPARHCARRRASCGGKEWKARPAAAYPVRRLHAARSRSGRSRHGHAGRCPGQSGRNHQAGCGGSELATAAAHEAAIGARICTANAIMTIGRNFWSCRRLGNPTKARQLITAGPPSRDTSAAKASLSGRNRADFCPKLPKYRL